MTLSSERVFAALTIAFGILALILASIGVYGIMAYSVSRSTNEIGIHMALGAGSIAAARLLTVIAVVSGFIPARRASNVDPMNALRHE